jgi:glycosyltransferase involved in cell wall biosynthesis
MSLKRIVIAHNFLSPHGGAEQSTYKTYQLLKKADYEVFLFGTNMTPLFEEFPHAELFPDYTNYDDLNTPLAKIKCLVKPFYNHHAEDQFREFLKKTQPDLVHFGSIHWHLSPSVIKPCTEMGIPTLMTLREARFVCPAGTLLKGNETYCKDVLCLKHSALEAIKHKCYENSLSKSVLVAAEFEFRKIHKLFSQVNQFICPSKALGNLVEKSGISAENISIIPNFVDDSWLNQELAPIAGNYLFYAGRLSQEKGVDIFLKALAIADRHYPVIIAGSGPAEKELKNLATKLELSQVKFIGAVPSNELKNWYKNALATVLPCNWFENFPRSVLESLAMGTAVIGSDIGGIPEMVIHNETGRLVEAGSIDALASELTYCMNHPKQVKEFGMNGHRMVKTLFNETEYLNSLLSSYQKVLSTRN